MRARTSRNLCIFIVFIMMFMLISWQFMFIHSVSASPTAKMYVHPQDQTVSSSFTVDINVTDVADLYSWSFKLNYSTSIITATSVTESSFLKQDIGTLWVGDNDDSIYKIFTSDPEETISSWDCTTSYPFGVEYINGCIYYVEYGPDKLYNKTLTGGTNSPVTGWDLHADMSNAYGLGWDGTYFLISDTTDDCIYFVSPSDPEGYVDTMTFTGCDDPESVTFDGTYYWVGNNGDSKVYKVDGSGTIQTSWSAGGDVNGLTHDGTNLWVCRDSNIYKYSEAGSLLATYTAPSSASEGLTSLVGPRSTFFLSNIDDANGRVTASATIQGDVAGLTGDGVLATINFDIDSSGTSALDLHETILQAYNVTGDKTLDHITHLRYDGSVTTTGVPEFPLGATAEMALAAVVIYLWWRRRKTKLYKSPTHLSSVP